MSSNNHLLLLLVVIGVLRLLLGSNSLQVRPSKSLDVHRLGDQSNESCAVRHGDNAWHDHVFDCRATRGRYEVCGLASLA